MTHARRRGPTGEGLANLRQGAEARSSGSDRCGRARCRVYSSLPALRDTAHISNLTPHQTTDALYLGLVVMFDDHDCQAFKTPEKVELVCCDIASPAQRFHNVNQAECPLLGGRRKAEPPYEVHVLPVCAGIACCWYVC